MNMNFADYVKLQKQDSSLSSFNMRKSFGDLKKVREGFMKNSKEDEP